jgi:hypothetical protein
MGSADVPVGRMSPAGSVVWALIPLFTLGMGTMFVLAWGPRLRSRALGVAAVMALIMTVLAFSLSGASDDAGSTASGVLIILLIGGGLTTTFMVRRQLVKPGYGDRTEAKAAPAWVPPAGQYHARAVWTRRSVKPSNVGTAGLKHDGSWNVTRLLHGSCGSADRISHGSSMTEASST